MKKTTIICLLVLSALAIAWSGDALAASQAEDQVIGIIERVLGVIADFFATIFQSIADAIKSVWTPNSSN